MANQTTIALKNSGTAGNTPGVGTNLAYGELAINYADGNLFYRTAIDTLSTYKLIVPGVNKDVIFNDNGVYGTSAGITFDKATANLAVSNTITTTDLNLNNITDITVGTYTTGNTNQVVVSVTPSSVYRTVKYTMQLTSGSSYHSEEITIVHNGTSVHIVEYGVVYSGGFSLGSFDATLIGSNIGLLFTPVNSSTTLKFVKTSISV
jgi:hypothetical protein